MPIERESMTGFENGKVAKMILMLECKIVIRKRANEWDVALSEGSEYSCGRKTSRAIMSGRVLDSLVLACGQSLWREVVERLTGC